MGQAIPTQHPAVVLRSHYRQLRALLAVALFAVAGLTTAVLILSTEDDRDTSAGSAIQVGSRAPTPASATTAAPRKAHAASPPPRPRLPATTAAPRKGAGVRGSSACRTSLECSGKLRQAATTSARAWPGRMVCDLP